MAVYAKINAAKPVVCQGGAMTWAPQAKSTQGAVFYTGFAETQPSMDPYAAVIDPRYKVGGETGWERPGSNLA